MVAIPKLLEQEDPIWTKKLSEMTTEERKEWFRRMTEISARNRAANPVHSEEEMEAIIQNYRSGIGD